MRVRIVVQDKGEARDKKDSAEIVWTTVPPDDRRDKRDAREMKRKGKELLINRGRKG